jgi:small-conductance mechanosensitive channel
LDAVILMLINFQINKKKQKSDSSEASIRLLGLIGRVLLWIVMVLMMLDNVPGIQITSLIASLGITGIAVALGVQSILGDLFASITIALDQPFKVGDFIEVDEKSGTVEKIGLRSSRLRAVSGEVIIVSNNTILDAWVRNYQGMIHRRVCFDLRLSYETPYALLSGIPELLKTIIDSFESAHFERVTFKSYTETGLIFEVIYFIGTKDFQTYMDLCHNINLTIFKRFEDEGIAFAVPKQKILLEK